MIKLIAKFSNKSKKQWSMGQIDDEFVNKARQQNYRSRAAFKILQIDEKFKLFEEQSKVLDLGCAPGGWCQAISRKYPKFKIVGVDLLKMDHISNIDFYQGDVMDNLFRNKILDKYEVFDIITSDMAPDFGGTSFQTHAEIIELNKMCLYISSLSLRPGGNIVMKSLQGVFQKSMFYTLEYFFKSAKRFKPKSSRTESSELFLIGLNLRAQKKQKLNKIMQINFEQNQLKASLLRRLI